MELLTPGIGLIFWQVVVFLLLLALLVKYAWKPIIQGLQKREQFISESLDAAEKARQSVEQTKEENARMLAEASRKREEVLKEALDAAARIKEDAQKDTKVIAEKMMADTKRDIAKEKRAAQQDFKRMVVSFSVEVAEKILRQKLQEKETQHVLINKYFDELKH